MYISPTYVYLSLIYICIHTFTYIEIYGKSNCIFYWEDSWTRDILSHKWYSFGSSSQHLMSSLIYKLKTVGGPWKFSTAPHRQEWNGATLEAAWLGHGAYCALRDPAGHHSIKHNFKQMPLALTNGTVTFTVLFNCLIYTFKKFCCIDWSGTSFIWKVKKLRLELMM